MQTKKAKKWSAGKIPDYDALLASARAKNEAERLATHAKGMKEQAVKRRLPPLQGEGKYDARVVQALVEILTGRPTQIRPQKIEMPETIFERIVLVLSSTEQFYYRVTEHGGCTCKGWHYSMQRFGIGKCRHHSMAFPEQAAQNMARIDAMKAERTGQVARKATASSSSDPGEPIMSENEKMGFKPFLEF
ncbi:MAG: hypothetical protein A4E49_02330 [Methanosaeta sp. PtaU1.Bin112]|jgi:hypothetical protein|nr:MAG: hypothetical protein A4E49_02330 [Methanosaeta sp. PtaU1.Bin112]